MTPIALLVAGLLAGAAPFVAEQPRVREGNEKLQTGDAAGALGRYDDAAREAGPHPEIDFDRGNALQAAGRHAEAQEAWKKAQEADQAGALASRALQNQGNALDAAGDQAGAAKAFAEALRRDPANEDARYNLEVLLRRQAAGQGKPKDEGKDGSKKKEEPEQGPGQQKDEPKPQDAKGQAPRPSPGEKPGQDRKDERRSAGDEQRKDQGTGGQAGPAGEHQPGDQGQRAGARPEGIGRQDAEKLLDAMRDRERSMPLSPTARKDGRKRENARDW